MYGLKQQPKDIGLIKGAGTGTSDSIKKDVPAGTYIMPADSTDQFGTKNLKKLGSPKQSINVSNGEFQLSPEQVHSLGVQTLDAMKDATHTPAPDKQGLGFKAQAAKTQSKMNGEAAKLGLNPSALAQYQDNIKIGKSGKPELYFANGGDVPEWDINDTTKAAVLGSAAALPAAAKAASAVPTITGSGGAVTAGQVAKGLVSGAWDGAKAVKNTNIPGISGNVAKSGLGRGYVLGSLAATAADVATTPTEQYRERFGLGDYNPDDGDGMRFAKDLGVRTLGAASDLGNNMTLRLAGKHLYRDMQSNDQENQTAIPQNKPNTANKLVAEKPVATPAVDSVAKANTPTTNLPSMFADTPAQNTNKLAGNPYAIQQKGNSFSYADAGAAAQARANGVPELQSSGIQPVQGVRGIKEFMANTREMGPNEQQIQNALAQREMNIGMQGFGGIARQPNAPQVRTPEQEAQLQSEIKHVSAPIAGSRGLTASQRNQINDLQMGYSNRENQRYITDANNATAIQREAMGQAGQNLRTTMGEQGANNRFNSNLGFEAQKFNATNDLDNREFNLTATEKGFGIRNSARVEKLYEQYDKAETDEQRQSIQEKINRYVGDKAESGNPYISVKRGEILDEKGNTIQSAGEVLFNRTTGQTIDPLAQMQQSNNLPNGMTRQVGTSNGKPVYEDAQGNRFIGN